MEMDIQVEPTAEAPDDSEAAPVPIRDPALACLAALKAEARRHYLSSAGTSPFRTAGTTGGWPVSFKMF